MVLDLTTPVKFLKRVGERVAADLARRGVVTVEDLLYHLPFRYEDRLHPRPITELEPGAMASVIGEVRGTVLLRTRGAPLFEMTVGQGTSTVKCLWFNGTYLRERFQLGQTVALYGQLEPSRSAAGRLKLIQPQFEILPAPGAKGEEFAMLEVGRIVPIYETLGGTTPWGAKLTSRWLRRVLWTVLEELAASGSTAETETLPRALLDRLNLPGRLAALRAVHFPEPGTPMTDLMSARTPAHRRLIFEEFFFLELGLELKRRRLHERKGTVFVTDEAVRRALKQVLPFHPTAAQKRALGEIAADMRRPEPMRRLLQGDVGSGKTIVAMQAALIAIENGFQVALMAPTEILATQHFLSARRLLADAVSPRTGRPYRVGLLTGSLDPAAKREAHGRIRRGDTELAIGTHALYQEKVDFANLGLVIVDEQHRFGVEQRFQLMRKPGSDGTPQEPDVLVMTATPIPRTLALTVYGDLDASVIDEPPPGRTPILTRRTATTRSSEVWEYVRKQVAKGKQAYVVYPVIEGTRDDQAELDFAHDDGASSSAAGGASRRAETSQRSSSKTTGRTIRTKTGTLIQAPAGASVRAPRGNTAKRLAPPARIRLRAAAEMFDELRNGALSGLRLGLLHGRLSPADKEVTMQRFARGEIDVLIATTVIEVGVDVQNATVMVIEHADRFGLAQLHQLRGRVGRGSARSVCILVASDRVSEAAEARLDAMVATQDGFALAELDLAQRGPGEFFGTRQAGLPELLVANLVRDRDLLELSRAEAASFAEAGYIHLPHREVEAVWSRLRDQWQRRYGLLEA